MVELLEAQNAHAYVLIVQFAAPFADVLAFSHLFDFALLLYSTSGLPLLGLCEISIGFSVVLGADSALFAVFHLVREVVVDFPRLTLDFPLAHPSGRL